LKGTNENIKNSKRIQLYKNKGDISNFNTTILLQDIWVQQVVRSLYILTTVQTYLSIIYYICEGMEVSRSQKQYPSWAGEY